jgi:hypothetical protein
VSRQCVVCAHCAQICSRKSKVTLFAPPVNSRRRLYAAGSHGAPRADAGVGHARGAAALFGQTSADRYEESKKRARKCVRAPAARARRRAQRARAARHHVAPRARLARSRERACASLPRMLHSLRMRCICGFAARRQQRTITRTLSRSARATRPSERSFG